jgi:anion transporter
MNTQALLTLIITLVFAILIISDKFRPDLLAMAVMVILGLFGLVKPDEIFSGFSSSPVITLVGIFIISEGLHLTGISAYLSRILFQLGRNSERMTILWVTLLSASLSLFMNNVAAVGILLPSVRSLTQKTGIAPGKLLIPLSYGTLLGGMATLFTTSNIIASGALRAAGYQEFKMLDFLPVGLPVVLAGAIYLMTVGKKLLPGASMITQTLTEDNDLDVKDHPGKTIIAIIITMLTLAITVANLIPVALGVMIGAVLMMITGCIKPSEAFQAIEWKVIFLIAGIWPLSIAIRTSGLADFLINSIGFQNLHLSPLWIAFILILIALIFTQFMSSQVSALVLVPIVFSVASQTGADVRSLTMAIALGCSLGFLTPYGHPVNLMVMEPGGYRFKDYVRVGTPLTIITIALILTGLALFWNLA